jgi:hypothetical protein
MGVKRSAFREFGSVPPERSLGEAEENSPQNFHSISFYCLGE